MATVDLTSDRALVRAAPFDVAAIAAERFHRSDFLALRRVRCEFAEGRLTLRGIVPSFHLKQLAQTLVRDLPGVSHIANWVEVATRES